MRISTTDPIKGGHVLYRIGKIKAPSTWHAANGAPRQDEWQELALRELIRRAEDIDADAIIGVDYEIDGVVSVEATGVRLERILATGMAVKLSWRRDGENPLATETSSEQALFNGAC